MNIISTLRFVLASLALVLAAFGCAPPAGEDEGIEVGSYTEELRVSQGTTGSSTDQCKTCGCSWRHDGYDNGCSVYRCVCTSKEDAECVVDNGGPGRPSESSTATYEDDVDVESPWRTRVQTSTPYLYRGI